MMATDRHDKFEKGLWADHDVHFGDQVIVANKGMVEGELCMYWTAPGGLITTCKETARTWAKILHNIKKRPGAGITPPQREPHRFSELVWKLGEKTS